jgi:ABC-type transport system involved in multi-copper enzyme maturation permease subunit
MIGHIARKEILENLSTYRFFILTGMLAVLMVVSIVVGYGDYELRLENYNLNKPKPRTSNVMIPPTPVSIFAKGVDAHLGRLYYITSMWIEVQDVDQSVNRLFALFVVPDLLFVIKVMLSLIALLFSFDTITSEKENGTLKLALSSGLSKIALLFGKLIGRFTLVFVPFVILFGAAAVLVSILPDVQTDFDFWTRIAFFLLTSALYVFLFAALGILLSSLVHRSSSSLILCCAVWVVFVFVIPEMGTTVARSVANVPPSDRINMEHRLSNVRAIYERIHQEEKIGGVRSYRQMVEEIRDENSAIAESYRPRLNNLIRLSRSIVSVSPPGALTFVLTDAAGTGVYEELRYKDAISMFAQRNFEFINDLRKGEMEDFHYDRASLSEVIARSSLFDLIVLVLFTLVFLALSMISFLRYDPR